MSIRLSLLLRIERPNGHHRVTKYHIYLCVDQIFEKVLRARVFGHQSGLGPMASKNEYCDVTAKILESVVVFAPNTATMNATHPTKLTFSH